MLGELFVGVGGGLIFSLVTTVCVELLPERSASLVALNSLGRNLFATVGSAITQPLLDAIHNGWLFSIVSVVTAANLLVIFLMKRFGKLWRLALSDGQTP